MILKTFGFSAVVAVLALVAGLLYGGWSGLALVLILGVLEISLSFDNAIINATVLRRMSPFWQTMFLTVGIIVAVLGMRFVFPLAIVWATSGMGPVEALDRALDPPAGGAAYFPDGTPSYEQAIVTAHPQIAAFGGMFLFTLFLDYILSSHEVTWLSWIERPLAKLGDMRGVTVILASAALLVSALFLAEPEASQDVLVAGLLGMIVYLLVNGLGELFENAQHDTIEEWEHEDESDGGADADVDADADTAGNATGSARGSGTTSLALATGRAGFFLFLYLEVLDASFSFDGVVGAFAITADPIIIALGLGLIGALFVRSITIFLVRTGSLDEYDYLEHGAHWAIGALAVILLVSVNHDLQIPDVVTGLIGVVFIGASFASSVAKNRREARAAAAA